MSDAHRVAWPEYARELTEPSRAHDRPEALDDLRVLDLSSGNFAALFTSSILAEFGAEVIRVEPPAGDRSMNCPRPLAARQWSAASTERAPKPPPTYHAIQLPCLVGAEDSAGPCPSGSPVT